MKKHLQKYHPDFRKKPVLEKTEKVEKNAEISTPNIASSELSELEETVAEAEGIAQPGNQNGNELSQGELESDPMENIVLEKEAIEYMLDTMFRGFSKMRKSKVWELDKDELKMISPLATKVANKWLPAAMKKYGEEIVLAFTFGQIILAKMMLEREEKKEAAAKLAAANSTGGSTNV